ncbi:MAG: sporulation protein YqfD [Oscillospiraceae bacterium]|jgi:similar to stage IV sporulation protein|nr:sporulation protein YqfD [Oscillospiraceae bacterium]MDE6998062.1 sporulation protein YqfD [Oscillospiraceae bacterium]
MLQRMVNLLKGEVTGRVESGFPERVLNLCAEYGVAFWNLNWESPVAFTFTMTRRDWKRLRRLSKNIDCEMAAVSWRGTPFFLGRMRYRVGLWATLLACTIGLFFGSFFIWDFEIEGNVNVSQQEILRALEKHGVGFGTYGFSVDSPELRNYMLLEIPELSYIAVNVNGCRAYVQVRERIFAPEIVDKKKAGNTVAAKDALVTAVQPWDGEKQVLPGTTVKAGQLLISGVVENDFAGARYLRGMGKVYGRTWYHLQCRVPLTVREKTYTGSEKVQRALLVGKKRINLYIGSSILGDTCDKITNWSKWELPGGVALPVTMVTETLRPYEVTEQQRSRQEALALAEEALDARLAGYLDEGEILSREVSSEVVDGDLVVTLSAECEEQIGKFVDAP